MNKLRSLFLCACLSGFASISAQDTVRPGDMWYLFNDGFSNEFCLPINYTITCASGMQVTHSVQPYVLPPSYHDGGYIYGVAITTYDSIALYNLPYSVGVWKMLEMIVDTAIYPSFFANLQRIAEANKRDIVRHCKFDYLPDSVDGVVECYEFYFDHPVSVSDTFYAGLSDGALMGLGLAGSINATTPQTWWHKIINPRAPGEWSLWSEFANTWGVVFPIIRPRCTAPREGEVIRVEGDSVVIQFVDDGEEHQYEVVYARDGFGVDTTAGERTAAPDSLFTFRGLEAGMRYWYRVRRSCTIGNMTVWSPWSQGYRLPATVGIRPDMEPVALEVKPNPANEYVEVTAEVPEGSLELRDAQGRLHLSQRLEGGHARIELQGVPAGVYTLQLRSAEGNATRRLIVK